MKCLNCSGPLEYAGANAAYARCQHCLSLFKNENPRLVPIQVEAPGGGNNPEFNAHYAAQLGFAPRKASHEVVGIGGVGAKINTAKMERDVKAKISSKLWGLAIGAFIIFVMVAVLAVVGLYVYFQAKDSSAGGPPPAAAGKATKWDGKSSFTCTGLDNVTLEGTTANIAAGNGINADGNCKLTLANVNVTAPVAINASGNAKITITGGSYHGSTNALVASGNAQITATGATVVGKTSATDNGKINGVTTSK